jgi:hypothetical protein
MVSFIIDCNGVNSNWGLNFSVFLFFALFAPARRGDSRVPAALARRHFMARRRRDARTHV